MAVRWANAATHPTAPFNGGFLLIALAKCQYWAGLGGRSAWAAHWSLALVTGNSHGLMARLVHGVMGRRVGAEVQRPNR